MDGSTRRLATNWRDMVQQTGDAFGHRNSSAYATMGFCSFYRPASLWLLPKQTQTTDPWQGDDLARGDGLFVFSGRAFRVRSVANGLVGVGCGIDGGYNLGPYMA
jgi:hypothetical protein